MDVAARAGQQAPRPAREMSEAGRATARPAAPGALGADPIIPKEHDMTAPPIPVVPTVNAPPLPTCPDCGATEGHADTCLRCPAAPRYSRSVATKSAAKTLAEYDSRCSSLTTDGGRSAEESPWFWLGRLSTALEILLSAIGES
jgi:hypothetical protein